MSARTAIEWTDATWNPVRGCSRVSEGCRNCYAERVAARFSGPGQPYEGLATMTPSGPRWTGVVRLVDERLLDPVRWTKPRRVFVNSMSDLFHESLSFDTIDRIFAVMQASPRHVFQVLTKRVRRMFDYLADEDRGAWVAEAGAKLAADQGWCHANEDGPWPLPNVWIGVSVENQAAADARVPLLLHTPAAVRFISAEPLLGAINFRPCHRCNHRGDVPEWPCSYCKGRRFEVPDWVIVGGESGPGARPMAATWARSLRDQCVEFGVPFFLKQWGEWAMPNQVRGDPRAFAAHDYVEDEYVGRYGKRVAGRDLDGRTWDEFPEVPPPP